MKHIYLSMELLRKIKVPYGMANMDMAKLFANIHLVLQTGGTSTSETPPASRRYLLRAYQKSCSTAATACFLANCDY